MKKEEEEEASRSWSSQEKSPQDYFCENVQYIYAEKDRWYQFVIRFFFLINVNISRKFELSKQRDNIFRKL